MFVGRTEELKVLEKQYESTSFSMVVVYGRRRVGKTALLERFAAGKNALFFTAQVQADADNLRDFSRTVANHFNLPASTPPFSTWLDALNYIADRSRDDKLVFVFDELPYAARSQSALPSALQVAIDHAFSKTSGLMVLCGSNQGFMEDEVLGSKSPLYGRRSAQIKLRPFDYVEASSMMPECSAQERISYYASLGGTPYYLAALDPCLGYVENMTRLFFTRTGIMFDEPNMLMQQELRDPAVYSSILRAIASGANKSNEIANRIGVPSTGIGGHLKTLSNLGIIERVVPFGKAKTSKQSIYRIADPAFQFWFHFVTPHIASIEGGLGEDIARRLLAGARRSEYEGKLFERVCAQWMLRKARKGSLPIQVTEVSSWWGTDPVAREQTDIDVVAADTLEKEMLLGECKWKREVDVSEVLKTLRGRQALIPGYSTRGFYLFVKEPINAKLSAGSYIVSAEDLFA